jgi:murein L,D-transpeptidase YafK
MRSHFRPARLAARALAATLAAAAVALLLWLGATGRSEEGLGRIRLAAHDAQRLLYAQLGWPLPGTPDLAHLKERLAGNGFTRGSPVFFRIFKREQELELWIKKGEAFSLFATYPICRFSGELGPKEREGDFQAPEGFYSVGRGQLNPNSVNHRAFNLGYPNLHDAALGRTGSFLMIHGKCISSGCYAMTDPVIEEIWELAVAALDGGQKRIGVHIFPFRMTGQNLAIFGGGRWGGFWRDLKAAYDFFEVSRTPPRIGVCAGRYVAETGTRGALGADELAERCPQNSARGRPSITATSR